MANSAEADAVAATISCQLTPLRPAYYELAMAGLLAEASGLELVAATVEMDLPELGAVGPALVVDLKPCPAIPAGPGQVITATFKHASADVMDLVLSDYPVSIPHSGLSVLNPPTTDPTSTPETIGVTGNHPFWSVDRAEFVVAGELAIGERLQTLSGDTKWVQQKLPRPGPEPVYNLEVQGEHVYYVGDSGVLAHNAYDSKHVYVATVNGRVAYVGSGTGGRVGTAYDRMVKELFNGNYAAAKKAKLRIKSKKLASEFEARGMEQKIMDYFGGAKGGQLANKNVTFRWGRMDSRAKKFRAAYRDEDLFSKTMKGLDLW